MFQALIAISYPGFVDLEYEIHPDDPMPGVIASFAYMRGVLAGYGIGEQWMKMKSLALTIGGEPGFLTRA